MKVVAKERPDIEKKKTQLLLRMAEDKKQLSDLEARILFLLSNSAGNILDDEVSRANKRILMCMQHNQQNRISTCVLTACLVRNTPVYQLTTQGCDGR